MSASGSIATRSKTGAPAESATSKSQELTGPQKAAVMLLILGEEYGKSIWNDLEEEEIRAISRAMAELGTVEAETVERLMVDFVAKLSNAGSVTGSFDRTESLLTKSCPRAKSA